MIGNVLAPKAVDSINGIRVEKDSITPLVPMPSQPLQAMLMKVLAITLERKEL